MTERHELEAHLDPHGQTHLLRHWDRLSADERERLAAEIRAIDFVRLAKLHRGETAVDDWAGMAHRAQSPPSVRLDGTGYRYTAAEARAAGERALRAGRVGAILVAGGQGTRLGFDHPKGMFPIGPVSNATLFQILFEKAVATARRYQTRIPLYLMTSPATHDETVAFLDEHERFGMAAEDLHVFCQATMPAVEADTGRVLLAQHGRLALSPDGHGGMLAAFEASGGLEDAKRRGLGHLFYFQVDNPLVQFCDPTFIGYHRLADSELSTQVVAKQAPNERVGNVVLVDDRVRIIEYSDLPASAGERRAANGSLVLWAGNTAIHVFTVAFLDRVRGDDQQLPFHVARKAVPHVDEHGSAVEPKQPNAIKFERFIFDLLPAAKRSIVVEIDPAEGFAPVKNASGSPTDSPETVQRTIAALHRQWLLTAGAAVADGVTVEISPLYALDADDVANRILPGQEFNENTYLGD
ncbi:MAG TPA: UTP--glucose-1-phosphate uridylyltransferase [Pirellulales bacterium]|jgi:UDP-N-acetylglucosamine/UDP-N-acetylgalactosamine diphosphorylase|nr:UTP--glucose-1-phosphate uridylyltransferase [Pirellulales bacterium]